MDKHITVGIAGHVDHGKTTLVLALTGIDTDRIKEEKIRGLSIEFGIAPLTLPSGATVSLVDVPGHTDFMKNTIGGLSAIDAAILVVAANDGVMPQTLEHFEILNFLGVETGFVVLSKADLVDSETLDLATLEVQNLVKGFFLEKSPIIPFDGITMRGREETLAAIQTLVSSAKVRKESDRPFRLFIDQIRIFRGLGLIVSGTILAGRLHRGDPLELLPSGQRTKVRSLQIHHSEIETATAGSRVGILLQGVSLEEISRGMVLAEPGSIRAGRYLHVEFFLSKRARKAVKTGQRVKTFLGTAVSGALVVVIGEEEIRPGHSGYAQLRLKDSIAAVPGDRFVVTPMDSPLLIGGGKVLETTTQKYRRVRASQTVPFLQALQSGDLGRIIEVTIAARPGNLIDPQEWCRSAGFDREGLGKILKNKVDSGDLKQIGDNTYLSSSYYRRVKNDIVPLVKGLLEKNPAVPQVNEDSIARAFSEKMDARALALLLKELIQEGKLVSVNGGISLPHFFRERVSAHENRVNEILATVEGCGMNQVSLVTVWRNHQGQDKREIQKILEHLRSKGKVVRLGNDRYLSCIALEELKKRVREWVEMHGHLKLGDCNEALGVGRTPGLSILEYLDKIDFTERRGDGRILKL